MKTSIFCFCFLVLGLKESAGENSTKVYYAVLRTEAGVIDRIMELLPTLNMGNPVQVNRLTVSTECRSLENQTQCNCTPGNIWSDDICDSESCNVQNIYPMCLPKTRVTITGYFSIKAAYYDSFADPESDQYKTFVDNLLPEMKTVYSTFRNFDSLRVTRLSRGSVIVHFELSVNSVLTSDDLAKKSSELETRLTVKMQLETKGLVEIIIPSSRVLYHSKVNITCKTNEDMALQHWELEKNSEVFEVTKGSESEISSNKKQTTVILSKISELWQGHYSCIFHTTSSNLTIVHKASATLNIALLPHIEMHSFTQFPRCESRLTEIVVVTVYCEIKNSTEHYTVKWHNSDKTRKITPYGFIPIQHDIIQYSAQTSVDCTAENIIPVVTCQFTNSKGQERNATVNMHIIYYNSKYCIEESPWPEAKAGFAAVLKCVKGIGKEQRKCLDDGQWEEKGSSNCVNVDLFELLGDALNLGKGLGSIVQTSPRIFSRLKNSTNNAESINSYANVDTSVSILQALHDVSRSQTLNESVLDDFLESSSNLLSVSLEASWTTEVENKSTISAAERYLESVEGLVGQTAIKGPKVATKPNVEFRACDQDCNVFNANVSMETSSSGLVKTVGFKFLNTYLPNQDNKTKPNAIVVSIIVEDNSTKSKGLTIDFQLSTPRPRNTKMECVFWDISKRSWSAEGCAWSGTNGENTAICKCSHLSAFTLLMATTPVDLPFLEEITYLGLSVSIISLLFCLGIECLVWNSIVKTKNLYLRQTAHVNISLCLLVADVSFLASAFPNDIPKNWCQICVILKHFFYLAMFFWMLCLCLVLLHQLIFVFHPLSKKVFLGFAFFLGYFCPLVIVSVTVVTYENGKESSYYNEESCWLIYKSVMKGSIHAFILPIGTIVIINVFSMVVVVMKILNTRMAQHHNREDKEVAKAILKTVILLTPLLGVTWFLGLFVTMLDLTNGIAASFVNYAFTILNAFQGLFLLLITCVADPMVRGALLKHFSVKQSSSQSQSSRSETSISSLKK